MFTLEFRQGDPSFPAFFRGTRILQEGNGCLDHDPLSMCPPSAIRLYPERPVFTCSTPGWSEAILSLCWLLKLQQPLVNQEENTPRVLMTIERPVECTMRRICFPTGSRP